MAIKFIKNNSMKKYDKCPFFQIDLIELDIFVKGLIEIAPLQTDVFELAY